MLAEVVRGADVDGVDSMLTLFQEFGIVGKLMHLLDASLQKRTNLEFAEAVLMMFLSCSQHKQVHYVISNSRYL